MLLAGAAAFVVFWVAWLIAWHAFLTWDRSGLWDTGLSANADAIVQFMPEDSQLLAIAPVTGLPAQRFMRDDLSYQVWSKGTLLVRSPGAPLGPLKPDGQDGFEDREVGGAPWRVYAVSDPKRHLQVQAGKPQRDRQQIVWWVMLGTLSTLSVLAVLLAAVIAWGVRWSLRPLAALERAVRARATFDLLPLSLEGLPREVSPLVESFNRLLAQLERAVALERRFVADAAHELRTPLAALMAQAHVLQRAQSEEERATALRSLTLGVARSARLSEQLLDLARLDAVDEAGYAPVDLGEVLRLSARDFEHVAQAKQQRLSCQLEPAVVLGSTDALGVLVRNLLDNATRYTQPGGEIIASCRAEGQQVVLCVTDNGPGVPAAARARIFDRFYRVEGSPGSGSGIGLSLVQRIALAHHGTLTLGEGPGFRLAVSFRGHERS
jgi:signal transduction histidine kinase